MQQHPLFDAILQQGNPGVPAGDQLQQVTMDHPYFTAAHFFLLQQMKKDDAAYLQQAAKTALLFNNPYWLQYQLQQSNEAVAAVKETPVIAMYAENSDNDDDTAELVQVKEIIPTVTEDAPDAELHTALKTREEEITASPVLPENSDNDEVSAILVSSPQEPGEIAANDTEQTEETKTEQEMPSIKIDLAAAIKEAENDHALSFEPMHLVDYFASQGIKLSDDIQPADKLGKQLKSFTEWLKTMKKVHVPDPETGAVTADISIQTLAEKSNAEGEIVTEAMAEVFAQQGKAGKAIEVYKKLSLLNPLKSAFFAAKIEQLKGS